MPIKVKIFGDLKNKLPQKASDIGAPIILNLNNKGIERISGIIEELPFKESEISHIYVNHKYSGFTKKVYDGDIVALFPKNMGLLYKWYYPKEEDD